MWDAEAYFYEKAEEPFMSTWTIYFNPSDFPGKYVARRHDIFRSEAEPRASDAHFVGDTLDEVRNKLPYGLACLHRSDGDEAQIMETWI
jgi:hypothetical protein